MTNYASPRLCLIFKARRAYSAHLSRGHNRLASLAFAADCLKALGHPPAVALDIVHSL
jgi:hypothetical protein